MGESETDSTFARLPSPCDAKRPTQISLRRQLGTPIRPVTMKCNTCGCSALWAFDDFLQTQRLGRMVELYIDHSHLPTNGVTLRHIAADKRQIVCMKCAIQ